jgi:hypothetical protein
VTTKFLADLRKVGNAASLSEMFVSQNIGKMVGLDPDALSLWVDFGVKDFTAATFPPSDFGMENVGAYDPGTMDVLGARMVLAKTYNVIIWFNPMGPGNWDIDNNLSRIAANLWFPITPFTVSVYYATNGYLPEKGKIGWAVAYDQTFDPIHVYGETEGTLNMQNTDKDAMWYSLALGVQYGIFQVRGEAWANKENLVESGIEFQVSPLKWFGLNTGASFNMEPGAVDMLDNVELGGWLSWQDGLKFRFGYLYTKNAGRGYSMYCPNPLQDGGVFFKCNVSF